MKNILRLEELLMFAAAVWLFYTATDYAGWVFWALLLAPDIGMAGYLISARTGTFTYNLLHHKGLAIILCCAGILLSQPALLPAGLILFGHSSMDRILGYGLKYNDSFHHTHLGMIGQKK